MRFNHFDLNLLLAFDVLLEEQNITRAAERLSMTQSATSGALSRLCQYFQDELLVQVGRKMVPTPYALELVPKVRDVLMTLRASIVAKPVFEPALSKRHFRVITSDYLITVLLAQVIETVQRNAPHITFEILGPSGSSDELLMRGEVDLIIVPERYVHDEHPSQMLFEEEHVCVICRHNVQVGESLSLEQYMDMGHVSVAFGRNRHLSIEEWLMSRYSFKRRLEVITHDFNTLAQLLVGTQRIATMHRRLAERYANYLPLRLLEPPMELPLMREYMVWHRSLDQDPVHQWLREQIVSATLAWSAKPS
ncbi:LysR family transcriptional regulator [Pseudomonas sp. MWU16-30317]|uniref:LysR family transcriptional regulator n=1 Tax=Pseudomonas sp. MWU16-30317 TaxID=2878095 RepID=UPI001CF96099|nr:LysR family transcriptional regulator [Pseudomonas sp. MWU16-30317]